MAAAAGGIFAENFKAEPYWWEAARPTGEGSVPPPADTDIAIIGSGYAGLSAALALRRAGAAVAVLEAEQFGQGASTRNGGSLSGGVNVGKGSRIPRAQLRAMIEEAADAYDHLEQVIAREEIDCRYARTGRFVGAHCPAAYDRLARQADLMNSAARAEVEMLPRARQHEEIETDYYHGGMLVRRAGGLHPALYHRGLLDAARRAGVTLCAETRVGRIGGAPGRLTLETSRGQVRAREVVVATNGYTGEATPWHRRRVIPVASYIIATEPLGEDRIRALFPKLRMISDTKRILYYFRPSPDGTRIVFGGRARFDRSGPRETAPVLYRFMCGIFPQIRGVKLTHAWNGNVAFTFDRVPHMGRQDGIHYCLGCNGSGVVMMSHLGHRTALDILGRSNRPSAFAARAMPSLPFYGGDPWFLPLIGEYYRARDWLDRRLGGVSG